MAGCCLPIMSSSCIWHTLRSRRKIGTITSIWTSLKTAGIWFALAFQKPHNSSCLPPYAAMEEPSKGSVLPSHRTLPSTEKTQEHKWGLPQPAKATLTAASFLNCTRIYGETLH